MKKYISTLTWLILLVFFLYYAYKYGIEISQQFGIIDKKVFIEPVVLLLAAGVALSGVVFNLLFSNMTTSLNIYKRRLEKESIDKTENKSKIKVLEAKIAVLEKALEAAVKK